LAFCPNCGSSNAPNARFCTNCAASLSEINETQSTSGFPGTEFSSRQRAFTNEESTALTKFGANRKQWAVSFGFVNMLLGVFAFVEPAQDFGSDGVSVLGAMTFSLGILALAFGVASRSSRKLASKTLAAGSVHESMGVVQGSNLRVTRVNLQEGGFLEVPGPGNAAKLGTDGSRTALVFSEPSTQPGKSKVILISTNGYLLARPLQCDFTWGGPR
jgi:hypothetical protein